MTPLEITVTGSSTITLRAERCAITLSVCSSGPSQDGVSQEVQSTTHTLKSLFEQLADQSRSVTAFSTTSLRTQSWTSDGSDGESPSTTYYATLHVEVVFQDFAKLEEVLGTLFTMSHVEIDATEWRLTDATKATLSSELRKAAMWDAMAKARDSAEVLGRNVVAVEVLDGEENYRRETKHTVRSADAASSAHAGSWVALEPEDVELSGSVEVKVVGGADEEAWSQRGGKAGLARMSDGKADLSSMGLYGRRQRARHDELVDD